MNFYCAIGNVLMFLFFNRISFGNAKYVEGRLKTLDVSGNSFVHLKICI